MNFMPIIIIIIIIVYIKIIMEKPVIIKKMLS